MPDRGQIRKYASGAALRGFEKPGEGLAAAMARLEGLEGVTIAAGILDASAADDDGTPLASIAFWNEYGTVNAPARPWMRHAFAENRGKWTRMAGKIVKARGSGGGDGFVEMDKLAEAVVEGLRDSLLNGPWARNAESTIKRKGFDKPLWETGDLHDSMSAEVSGIGARAIKARV